MKPVIVDMCARDCSHDVIHPNCLQKIEFDFIYITLIDKEAEVEKYLLYSVGIAEEKIKRFNLQL